jgi:AcrR family transcriptional regulator
MQMAIAAGHHIIVKEGLAALSTRKVAGRIGYTVGTLYHLFGSYDHYLLHVNAKTLDEWYAALQSLSAAHRKPLSVQALAEFYIDYSSRNYHAWSALFEHRLGPDQSVPEWYLPKMRRFFDFVEVLVLPHANHQPAKARRAARVLWAGIHGICVLSHTKKLDLVGAESPRILARSFVTSYMKGLK